MGNQLGVHTNSVQNWMYGDIKPVEPEVGMGGTILMYSDRYAVTIHKVEKNKLWASEDNAERIDNNGPFSESQEYRYTNDNQDHEERWNLFTLRKDGRWHMGKSMNGAILLVGKRMQYIDPSF